MPAWVYIALAGYCAVGIMLCFTLVVLGSRKKPEASEIVTPREMKARRRFRPGKSSIGRPCGQLVISTEDRRLLGRGMSLKQYGTTREGIIPSGGSKRNILGGRLKGYSSDGTSEPMVGSGRSQLGWVEASAKNYGTTGERLV